MRQYFGYRFINCTPTDIDVYEMLLFDYGDINILYNYELLLKLLRDNNTALICVDIYSDDGISEFKFLFENTIYINPIQFDIKFYTNHIKK